MNRRNWIAAGLLGLLVGLPIVRGADAVPAEDPKPETPVKFPEAMKGKHPRLLFTNEEIPELKKLADGEGKPFYDQLLAYNKVCTPPKDTKFLTDDTDAQRQGMWRLPTLCLHYAMTGAKSDIANAEGYLKLLLSLEHWQEGKELDSGMGAGNILLGAGLTYDTFYKELDPTLRDDFRKKLLLQARRMYYYGHLMKSDAIHYWQNDPQNNHRWHRDAGLTMAVLAIADEEPEAAWILSKLTEELALLHKWLPEDGTSHESSAYLVFGAPYITLAFDASDRVMGTKYLDHPFFKNTSEFRLHTLTPGLKEVFHYGDSAGFGAINSYAFLGASRTKNADVLDGLMDFFNIHKDNAFNYGVYSLLWYRPAGKQGDLHNIEKRKFYDDIGALFLRDGWDEQNTGLLFHCGAYGGLKLNEFRNSNDYSYVNVAHDDPDANMFVLYSNGALLADDDRYAKVKLTSSHNTILVNGKGQTGEGTQWTQPPKGKVDMTKLSHITAYKSEGPLAVAQGEAGKTYQGLDHYRRTIGWVEGGYVLIVDDIGGKADNEVTWLVQGVSVKITDPAGKFRLENGKAACDFTMASDAPFEAAIADSTAESHGKSLGYKQLQLKSKAQHRWIATVFDPWNKKAVVAKLSVNKGKATIEVQGDGVADVWTCDLTTDESKPSAVNVKRQGGAAFDLK
jgi:hypothetical protein